MTPPCGAGPPLRFAPSAIEIRVLPLVFGLGSFSAATQVRGTACRNVCVSLLGDWHCDENSLRPTCLLYVSHVGGECQSAFFFIRMMLSFSFKENSERKGDDGEIPSADVQHTYTYTEKRDRL